MEIFHAGVDFIHANKTDIKQNIFVSFIIVQTSQNVIITWTWYVGLLFCSLVNQAYVNKELHHLVYPTTLTSIMIFHC